MTLKYALPFVGNEVMISQGYNGPWTHKKIRDLMDQTYSLDFALPIGTDVIAAREGKVRIYYDKFKSHYEGYDFEVGSRFFANFIDIVHGDSTIACYQHLALGSVGQLGIREGDSVKQGDVLGKTGLSGWIGAVPHLHFMVYEKRPEAYKGRMVRVIFTMPVDFENYDGPLEHRVLFSRSGRW